LAKKLDRQVRIIRQAHNQLAGRHVFNEKFVSGENQLGAIATQTMGGFFLKEEGTTLQSQQQTFENIQEIIRPAAAVIADISDEVRILAGIPRPRVPLREVINNLLSQIRPDASGEAFKFLVELADIASYLADQFKKSVNRALVDFTDDEYRGTRGSGTAADVIGGRRIINDVHDFDAIVKNLKTQKTGVDLISWWEQNDQDYGLKGYGYDLYQKRVDGEVSKFYARGAEPRGLDNLWSYLTPARIKMAGRKPMSPYSLGKLTNTRMYSYEQYADLEADLYDYKFNAPHVSRYHVYEPSYTADNPTEDRNPPEHYSNKTITQLLNQHCEIEIEAIDVSYTTPTGEVKLSKSEHTKGEHSAGITKVFGDPTDSTDETTSENAEAAFGDNTSQWDKKSEDYYESIVKNETKKSIPMVTRIFYTLMGEMVLTPTTTKYADARFNAFAGVDDMIASDTESAIAAESIEEFEERQEERRERLGEAERRLADCERLAQDLATRLHQEDIDNNNRHAVQGPPDYNNEPYPVPSLMDRLDPLYEFATVGGWHPVLYAEREGYFNNGFLDRVRRINTQERRVDAICEYVNAHVITLSCPNDLCNSIEYYMYEPLGKMCAALRDCAGPRREVAVQRDQLEEREPGFGDIREVGLRQTGLPIQLQALTDMANYIAPAQSFGRQNIPYNQPFVDSEPYREIPIPRSMLAIIAQEGGRIDLAKVYDTMKDHSKFAPFWYNFKHIYEIQYLAGFDYNIKSPIWLRLRENSRFGGIPQDQQTGGEGSASTDPMAGGGDPLLGQEEVPILCRIVGYENEPYGVAGLGTTSLPIYNNYFFLDKETEASIPPGQETPTDLYTFEPSFTPLDLIVPMPEVTTPAGIPTSPKTALTQGNPTAFFGVTPAAASVADFSGLKFDTKAAGNAGLINPSRDLGMVGGTNVVAAGANVTKAAALGGIIGY
jgi:hypothetical protein